jgi:hypothetical protein
MQNLQNIATQYHDGVLTREEFMAHTLDALLALDPTGWDKVADIFANAMFMTGAEKTA